MSERQRAPTRSRSPACRSAAGRWRTGTSSRRPSSSAAGSSRRRAGATGSTTRRPGWSTFVAERDGLVVGFTSVGPSRDERGLGELYAIYVDPDEWSTGAGRALIERAEEQLRGDYEEVTLWVLEQNPRARRFYEHAGWAEDGERKAEARWGVRAPEVRYRKRFTS